MERRTKPLHASVRRALRQAWELNDADKAERLLRNLARRLDQKAPAVAASILEGLDEMLTVNRLGLPVKLRRSLACTNSIENMMGTVRRVCRNVKRWRNAAMALRWTAAGMMEAAKGFRRPFSELRLQLISPSTSPTELNTTLTTHSIIHDDACFDYLNKIWVIPLAHVIPLKRILSVNHRPAIVHMAFVEYGWHRPLRANQNNDGALSIDCCLPGIWTVANRFSPFPHIAQSAIARETAWPCKRVGSRAGVAGGPLSVNYRRIYRMSGGERVRVKRAQSHCFRLILTMDEPRAAP